MTHVNTPYGSDSTYRSVMTARRGGTGITPTPDGIANGPFLAQMLLSSQRDGEMTAMRAFLEPGITTNWHSHPCGQYLFVLDGIGLVQRRGGEVIEVRAGDGIWFPPDEPHWHGASPHSAFSYISVQQVKDGTAVHWEGPVDSRSSR